MNPKTPDDEQAGDALQSIDFSLTPIREDDGQVSLLVAEGHDITDRVRAESQRDATLATLRESERKYRELVENANSIMFRMDTQGCVTFINEFAQRFFGYTEQEILGRNVVGTIVPEQESSGRDLASMIEDILEHPERYTNNENENVRRNGQRVWVAWTNKAILDRQGRITEILCIGNDITEQKLAKLALKQAYDRLAEANRELQKVTQAKSEFLANMSHELRTPLNAIIGMAGLLLDTQLDAEQRDFSETVRTSADILLTLINHILDFSKIEAGKLELEDQPFDLQHCIEEALDLVAPKAADKGLELAYMIDDKLPETIIGDVTRLRQVLVNLLSNAVKFTEAGEVILSVIGQTQKDGGYQLRFAVRDTGIGIPKDKMDRLFQSFSQVDASTARRYGGTGLGLIISKHLCEAMGGTMWAESAGVPGQGSTFYFTILARITAGQLIKNGLHDQGELTGKRVLIVDDSDTNRRILCHQTRSWGMLPTAVASGPQAVVLIRANTPFDVAILDMWMPDTDGIALAADIRKYRDPEVLPLIMLTSLGQRKGDENLQFAACLTKPIKPSHLYNVLVEVVSGQAASPRRFRPLPKLDRQMAQLHPLHILLAEDNMVNQKVALSILKRVGYRADVAANGLEVLEALARQPYDAILMDVQMPEMDGLEATRLIRQQWPIDQQPHIIALTANALQGDRERFLAAGMDDYISKPIQIEELMHVMSQVKPLAGRADKPHQNLSGSPSTKMTGWGTSAAMMHPVSDSSPLGSTPAVDVATLKEFQAKLGEDGAEIVTELVTIFLDDTPKLLRDLEAHLAQGNTEGFQRSAHTLKGNSATFGAIGMSALCGELEAMGRAGTLQGAAGKMAQVEAEFERVRTAMAEFCPSISSYIV